MSATRVQTVAGNGGGYSSSFNISVTGAVTGNLLVVSLYHGGASSVSSMSDGTNTYTLVNDSGGSPPYADGSMFYAQNITGGNLTIAVTLSDYAYPCWIVREYSGIETVALDQKAENLDGGYTKNHATGTTSATTQNNELVVACYVGDLATDTYTISGFSNKTESNNTTYGEVVFADKDVTSTGTQAGTFVGAAYTNGWGCIATFKEAAAPSATRVHGLTLLGAGC